MVQLSIKGVDDIFAYIKKEINPEIIAFRGGLVLKSIENVKAKSDGIQSNHDECVGCLSAAIYIICIKLLAIFEPIFHNHQFAHEHSISCCIRVSRLTESNVHI